MIPGGSGGAVRRRGTGLASADDRPFNRETPMPPTAERHWLESEEAGNVTVVRFVPRRIVDEHDILGIFAELNCLVDGGSRRLVLNFGNVEYCASYAIGKLVGLDRKVQAARGRLALCRLTPVVAEIIDIMQLRRKFAIYATEQDALASF
jgi:anti-sigma B factor antagonist